MMQQVTDMYERIDISKGREVSEVQSWQHQVDGWGAIRQSIQSMQQLLLEWLLTCIALSKDPAATWSAAKGEFRTHKSLSSGPGVAPAPSSSSGCSSSACASWNSSSSAPRSHPPSSGSISSCVSSSLAQSSNADIAEPPAAASPLTYEGSIPPSKFPLAKARSKKFSPAEIVGQVRSVVDVTTGGGLTVVAWAKEGTSSTSAGVKLASSKISSAISSNPWVFAVRYARGSR